jgi:hypothetical protein
LKYIQHRLERLNIRDKEWNETLQLLCIRRVLPGRGLCSKLSLFR